MTNSRTVFLHIPKVSLLRLILVLILLGPPTLREGREAATVFESPLANLDWSYVLHLAIWGFAGLYAILRFIQKPILLSTLAILARTPPFRWYILFAFTSLLSAMWSIFPLYTLFFSYKIWVTIFLVVAIVRESTIHGRSPLRVLLESVGLAYSLGLTLLFFLFIINPELVTRPSLGLIGFRLTGGFLSDYGAYALITLAFLASGYLFGRKIALAPLKGLMVLWALVALILAQTRSTLVAGFLTWLVFVIFGTRGARRIVWATGFCIAGILTSVVAKDMLLEFLKRGQDTTGLLTLSGRTTLFQFLIQYWRESPFVGYGFQAGSRYASAQFLEQTGLMMGAAHDLISKVLVDLGLLGALFVICALFSLLRSLVVLRRWLARDEWLLTVSLALYALMSSTFGGGVAEAWPIWVVLFMLPSIAFRYVRKRG